MDLVKDVTKALLARKWLMASAESCTGGLIAKMMTDHAGSSAVFERGFVTYSNEAKMDLLDVSQEILERYGAVSEETAAEMVGGALKNSLASIVVSVTGIAGPGGGTDTKPVGLVYIGYGIKNEQPIIEKCLFSGDRESIREQSAHKALTLILNAIENS